MADRPVFFFARVLPDYRVSALEHLNARLGGRLVVCTGQPPGTSSLQSIAVEKTYGFRRLDLRNIWFRGEALHVQFFGKPFRARGLPAAILAEESPRSILLPFLLAYARRRGVGTVLWGHFSSNERPFAPAHNRADRYRLWLARRADACACYTEAIADLLRPYIPAERLFVARNTLDTDALFALHDDLARAGKAAVRRRLDLPEGRPVLIFVGRLIPAKGTDLLLDVFGRLRAEQPAVLLVVGDGPERAAMEARVARDELEGVRFVGATTLEASAPYLYAADLMLMPGPLGLAVNHAFAFGIPVVSQAGPQGVRYHGPEAAYVQPGRNGILAEHGNLEALVGAVRRVLADHDRFAAHARAYAQEYLTLDRMVDGLVEAIAYAEAHPRKPR